MGMLMNLLVLAVCIGSVYSIGEPVKAVEEIVGGPHIGLAGLESFKKMYRRGMQGASVVKRQEEVMEVATTEDPWGEDWAMAIIKAQFPLLIGKSIHESDSKQVWYSICKARDFLVQRLLSELGLSEQAVCVFTEDILDVMNFVLKLHISSIKTGLSAAISHEVLHGVELSEECLASIESGQVLEQAYAIFDKSLGKLTADKFGLPYVEEYYHASARAYLLQPGSLKYTADEVVLKLFSYAADWIGQIQPHLKYDTAKCTEIILNVDATLSAAYNTLKASLSSQTAIMVEFERTKENQCFNIIDALAKSIYENLALYSSPLTLMADVIRDIHNLVQDANEVKPKFWSSIFKIFESAYIADHTGLHMENVMDEIMAGVSKKAPVAVSNDAKQISLKHLMMGVYLMSNEMETYFGNDCFDAKIVAMLIGFAQLKGIHILAVSQRSLIHAADQIHSFIAAVHPEMRDEFRNIIEERLTALLKTHFRDIVFKHVQDMRVLTHNSSTDNIAIEITMLPTHFKDGDMTTFEDLLSHVNEHLVMEFSRGKKMNVTHCAYHDEFIYDNAAKHISAFIDSLTAVNFITSDVVMALVNSDEVPVEYITWEVLQQVKAVILNLLQSQTPRQFEDYLVLSMDMAMGYCEPRDILVKYIANSLAKEIYWQLHQRQDQPPVCDKEMCDNKIYIQSAENLKHIVAWQHKAVSEFLNKYMMHMSQLISDLASSDNADLCKMVPDLCMGFNGVNLFRRGNEEGIKKK